MDKRILKLLYRSLDSALKGKDQRRLDKALEESEELRRHKIKIESLRQAIADGAIRSFRPQFVEHALNRIQAAQSAEDNPHIYFEIFKTVFKRFAIAAVFIIIVLIFYNLANNDLLPKNEIFYASDLTIGKILQLPII